MTGGDSPLGLVKNHLITRCCGRHQRALVSLPIARLHRQPNWQRRSLIDPVDFSAMQGSAKQRCVGVALGNAKNIPLQVFMHHIPGCLGGVLDTADAQALALSQGIEHQALMASQQLVVKGHDRARLGRQVLFEKVFEAPLTDKTDAGGVFFVECHQAIGLGNTPDLGLLQFAQGKQAVLKLAGGDRLEKVTLVLTLVQGFQQARLVNPLVCDVMVEAGIVARGNQFCTQHLGVLEKNFEFNLTIAQDVRIGGPAEAIFVEKVSKDIIPVLGGKIGFMELNAQLVADLARIFKIFAGRAVLGAIVFFPVFHEQASDPEAGVAQQQGGHGGVNAARHADNHRGVLDRFAQWWVVRWVVRWVVHSVKPGSGCWHSSLHSSMISAELVQTKAAFYVRIPRTSMFAWRR